MDFLSVALYVLSWILTLIFLRAGLVKVTSRLFSKDHKETRQEFAQYATVCPTVLFGITWIHAFGRSHRDACLYPAFGALHRFAYLDIFSILCHVGAFNLHT